MVGLLLVSHSKRLAESVRELVVQMTAPEFPVAVASGAGEDHEQLGTDAIHIADVLGALLRREGVAVFMDLGSAVLSAKTAVELLDLSPATPVELCAAPFVEGAVAAAVTSFAGGVLQLVCHEAQRGLLGKQQQLEPDPFTPPVTDSPHTTGTSAELVLVVNNEHGLHARPASRLVQLVSRFSSTIDIFNMTRRRGPAPANSLSSIALLEVCQGDRIRIVATGADREMAVQAIRTLATQGFGETPREAEQPKRLPKTDNSSEKASSTWRGGMPGSPGIAIGPLLPLHDSPLPVEDAIVSDPVTEFAKLTAALEVVSQQLQHASPNVQAGAPVAVADILQAQSLILRDPTLLAIVRSTLEREKTSAGRAFREVTEGLASRYETMSDQYLRDRAADVRDISRRVLMALSANGSQTSVQLETPSIIFAHELLPSEASACDPAKVLGVITREGSPTSHSAILLRTLGIPMVVGVGALDESMTQGKTVALDGDTGQVWVEPNSQIIAMLQQRQAEQRELYLRAAVHRSEATVTLDGVRIEVLANVASASEATDAVSNGAEGIGLLRTEFLFLTRKDAPSEGEQSQALREILSLVTGPIIVRTLDAGADKPLPYVLQAAESNPFLGRRGIRLSLTDEESFTTHLRSILAAGFGHDLWVMFPMIAVLKEAQRARDLLERAHTQLERSGRPHSWPVKAGAMIEVPSAALMSEQLAEELDFFSIGTNDLTQYVMAAERGNASVAELQDSLHPAVLRLVRMVIDSAATRQRHVSICGDAASDREAATVYAGLGIHSLSVRPNQVAEIKALFRNLRDVDLKQLAVDALKCRDSSQVRKLVNDYLSSASRTN